MNNDSVYPEWQNQPFRLNQEEVEDPSIVLYDFIQRRRLPEHRAMLENIFKAALTSAKNDFTGADDVCEWVLYWMQLERLVEAVFMSAASRNKAPV